MASHAHTQIRDAIVAALTGLPSTGSRVFANRLRPLLESELPALRIYADEETSNQLTVHFPHMQSRDLSVTIEAVAKHSSGLDDVLDQMSNEVEAAFAGGIVVGGVKLDPVYIGMSFDDEQSDKPIGVKRMRFAIQYQAMNNAPDILT